MSPNEEIKFYKEVIENMICGYAFHEAVYDENGKFYSYRYINVNKTFEDLTGKKKKDIIGKTIFEVFPETERHWIDFFGKVVETGEPAVYENFHKATGEYYQTHAWRSKPDTFSCTFTNITEKKLQHIALEKSEERYKGLIDSQNALIIRINREGDIILVNESYCEKFGVKRENILGTRFAPKIHANDEEETREIMKTLFKEHRSSMVQRNWTPNGWAIISWEDRIIANEIQAIGYDITELREKEEDLRRSNKDLENFAYVASHDLQEPLRKITAFEGLLMDDIEKKEGIIGDDGKFYLQRISDAAFRMKNLIDDLLDYSRISRSVDPFEDCDMNKILKDVVENLFKDRIKKIDPDIEIGKIPSVDGDIVQIRQLFQNLISNSLKFRDKNRKLFIGISSEISENNKSCVLTFKDNGIGFDPKHSDKVFGSFKKLHSKDEYPGSGIGLAICKRIVERHKWKIEVSSKLNVGTVFKITFPVENGESPDEQLRKKTNIDSG